MTSTFRVALAAVFLPILLLIAWPATPMGEAVKQESPHAADLQQLLDDVRQIGKPGIPGPVAVFGPDAFPVFLGEDGNGVAYPVVAAAKPRRGRVVAFGHGGYFSAGTLNDHDTAKLLLNAVRWAADDEDPTVAVLGEGSVRARLHAAGVELLAADSEWRTIYREADVIVAANELPHGEDEQEDLCRWIERGGGLVTAGLGWGWQQINSRQDLVTDFHLNQILQPLGLSFGDGYLDRMLPVPADLPADFGVRANARQAWEAILTDGALPNRAARKQAAAIVVHAVQSIPVDEETFATPIRAYLADRPLPVPTEARPVTVDQPLDRVALTVWHQDVARMDARDVPAFPGANTFPGLDAETARSTRLRVAVDATIPGWASTGYYALPGEPVTVSVDEEILSVDLFVRIGCHTDRLLGKDQWKRFPELSRRWPLTERRMDVVSPHGGLVYIEVPNAAEALGRFEVSLAGGIAAPRFVFGETTVDEWRDELRNCPGPWAELSANNITVTVPSRAIRELDDPTPVLELWDEIMACYSELGQRPLNRRPQRMVPDVQISAGYMHSGYPIMMWMDQEPILASAEALREGQWGLYHELGHNHQRPEWTFGGTTEVTCNLFTLFVFDRVCGKDIDEAMIARDIPWREYLQGDQPFSHWQQQPFLALMMYVQIIDEFGWDALQETFAAYEALPASQRPRDDDAKRDTWLRMLSRTVGRDLSPFFGLWRVPVSEAAVNSLADLESWTLDPALIAGE